ncbi:MAG: DUF3135 domain-containing protein [Thermodesulfobacteria bacterium]|nr:DUF3135 domain-containing protein [Thermodesulfobacteriota bacterium]
MNRATNKTDDFLNRLELLHELDDEAFEQERKRIIEEEISKYPPKTQDKLRKFQWTLDMKRKKCKNSLEACFMFHDMLMEHVYGENGLLESLDLLAKTANELFATSKFIDVEPKAKPIGAKEDPVQKTKATVVRLANFRKGHQAHDGKRVSGR